MKMQCPQCGVRGSVNGEFRGKTVRCPKCSTRFVAEEINDAALNEPPPVEAEKEMVSPEQPVLQSLAEAPLPAAGDSAAPEGSPRDERNADEGVAEPELPQAIEPPLPPVEDELPEESQAKPAPHDKNLSGTGDEDESPSPPEPEARQAEVKLVVGDVLREAWELTGGVKGPIWGGMLVTYGLMTLLYMVIAGVSVLFGEDGAAFISLIGELASSVLSAILTGGLMYMGVKRAANRKVGWKDVFCGFEVAAKIIIASLLQMVLILIGFFLLILPGIYLAVGYFMTLPLIIDKGLSPWEAMETSRKAVHQVWWKILGLYIVVGLILAVSALPLGIGLIWTLPMSIVLVGVVYYALFPDEKMAD